MTLKLLIQQDQQRLLKRIAEEAGEHKGGMPPIHNWRSPWQKGFKTESRLPWGWWGKG